MPIVADPSIPPEPYPWKKPPGQPCSARGLLEVLATSCEGRGCPCPVAGRSLRPSRASFARRCLRSGGHRSAAGGLVVASAGHLRRLSGHGQHLPAPCFCALAKERQRAASNAAASRGRADAAPAVSILVDPRSSNAAAGMAGLLLPPNRYASYTAGPGGHARPRMPMIPSGRRTALTASFERCRV
jgi:hypothetical protein